MRGAASRRPRRRPRPAAARGLRRAGRRLSLAVLVGALAAAPAAGTLEAQASSASAFLPVDHWARDALVRLQAAGFVGADLDPGTASIGGSTALDLLAAAAEEARPSSPEWASLAEAWHARLVEELPASAAHAAGAAGMGVEGRLSAGMGVRRNALLARHQPSGGGSPGTVELDNVSSPAGELGMDLLIPGRGISFAARGAVAYDGEDWRASEAYGVLHAGPVGAWGGRRAVGFGTSNGGSLVVSPRVPLDGGGLFLASPARFPGFLSFLGSFGLETSFHRMEWSGQIDSPWFFAARASLAPHERVRIGVNRGAFFAGSNNAKRPNVGRVLKVIAGIETETVGDANFANHVASVDIWVAPRLGSVPVILYAEYGVEDLSRKTTDMPGVILGSRLPGLPGLPEASLGVEWTKIGKLEGVRPWYDHRVFGSWTDGGEPLGHGLGGVGREWRTYGTVDLPRARVRLDVAGFDRRREAENLYAPEREGTSWGLEGGLGWRATPGMELVARGSWERGDDWQEGSTFVGGRLFFF